MFFIKNKFNYRFAKNFIRYATTSLFCRGLTFLIAPITISFLSPKEFGLLSLTNSFVVIIGIITNLGLRHVLLLEYVHHTQKEQTRLVSNLIVTYFIIALPIFIFLFINQSNINHYFFCNQSSASLITISLAFCFFSFFVEFFQQLLQLQTKISLSTKLHLTSASCSIILIIIFIVFFKMGIVGIILAQLLGTIAAYSHHFWCKIKHVFCWSNFDELKKTTTYYLKIGLPFIPGMLSNWIMASGDKWFLARYSSIENVGIYTLADACGSLFHIIVSNSLAAIYVPFLLKKFSAHKENINKLETKNKQIMAISLIVAFIVVTIGYFITKPILYRILPQSYTISVQYIWFTFVGYILLMGTYFASILIQFHKRSLFLACSLIIPASCNCILNRLLIPQYAIYGSLIATISSYLVYFVITIAYNYYLSAQQNKKLVTFPHQSTNMVHAAYACKKQLK